MPICKVLGPIEFVDAEGCRVDLVSAAQRRLVAVLSLHARPAVSAGVLEEFVGLSPGALRTSISRLRRLIGPECVVTGSTGYEFRANVDAEEFVRLVDGGFAADDIAARTALEAGLALWRGPPCHEFDHEPWAVGEGLRLSGLRAAAVEELAVLMLDSGEHVGATAVLESLIVAEPYRDRTRALLVRALADAGRRTDALRAFHDYRSLLIADIGIEPSSDLVALDRAVASSTDVSLLRGAGHMAWLRTRGGSVPSPSASRHNLPTPISSFVGRAAEVTEIVGVVGLHRLVTLTGAGGCGKSRLALRVARIVHDGRQTGTWWVDLTVIPEHGDVAERVAISLGLMGGPSSFGDLTSRLGGNERTFLVLDNAEHVLEPTVRFLIDLLTRCPAVHVLVTSRVALGVPGEVLWRVPSLGLPTSMSVVSLDDLDRLDATKLFVTRAREARPGLVIDRQAIGDVVAICEGVDGLVLALELAAARMRACTLQEVARSVTEMLGWELSSRPALDRHATLRSSIGWSFDLIEPLDRSVLTALAVFQSAFTTQAAIAITALNADQTRAALARLVDASLIQLDDGDGRFRLLQTIKQFCLERPDGDQELQRARHAHAIYFSRWCVEVGAGMHGIERRLFVQQMPDVAAASAYCREHLPVEAMRMCAGLAPVRSALGHHADFDATWRWLMSLDRDDLTGEWAAAVAGLMATATSYDFDTAGVAQLVVDRLEPGQHRARSWIERGAAMVPAYQGRPDAIEAYVAGVLARGDDLEASVYAGFAAYMLALLGRVDPSERLLEQLRRISRHHATTFSVDSVGNGYAAAIVVDTTRGDLRSAIRRANRPLPIDPAFTMTAAAALAQAGALADHRDTMERAVAWSQHGTLPRLRYLPSLIACLTASMSGALDEAADRAEDFWEQASVVPVSLCHPWPLVNAALVAAGRDGAAERATDAVASLVDAMDGAPLPRAGVALSRAQIALRRGQLDVVERHAIALLDLAQSNRFRVLVVDALELMAMVVAERGDADTAASVFGATDVERSGIGYRFTMVPTVRTAASSTVAHTGEGALAIDQAIELVRRVSAVQLTR